MHSFPLLFGKKKFPSLIKHSPWAYSTPTLLIFPHNNSMLSLTLLFSFVYTRCWQSTPPSKLSSAIPYHKISLQAYKETVFTFFFFDHYKGRQARGHLCEYLFLNHNRDSATFKKVQEFRIPLLGLWGSCSVTPFFTTDDRLRLSWLGEILQNSF